MGFLDSKIFQDLLSMTIIAFFAMAVYSLFRKQTVKDTMAQIKEWWNNLDGEE